jgi:phosphate/sulfate permease
MAQIHSNLDTITTPTEVEPSGTGLGRRMRAILLLTVGTGLGIGAMLLLASPSAVEPSLARVMHLMLAIKSMILAAATVLVLWRLGSPVSTTASWTYSVGLGVSAAGLAWLWGLSAILIGVVLFYGGLLIAFMTATRDRQLFAALKATLDKRREARLGR